MGRWFTHDPLGTIANISLDSINLYEYVISNPIQYIDGLGLESMSYQFENNWPWYWRETKRKEMKNIYATEKWKLLLPWHLSNAIYITEKAAGVVAFGLHHGYYRAAEYMSNYMLNWGLDEYFSVKGLIGDVKDAKSLFDNDLNAALAFAEGPMGAFGSPFYSKSWVAHEPGYNGSLVAEADWRYSIQEYFAAARGKAKCIGSSDADYELEFVYRVEDEYYWMNDDKRKISWIVYQNKSIPEIKLEVSITHQELRQMHLYGRMQMFEVHGFPYTVKVKWNKGQRIGTGAKIIE